MPPVIEMGISFTWKFKNIKGGPPEEKPPLRKD